MNIYLSQLILKIYYLLINNKWLIQILNLEQNQIVSSLDLIIKKMVVNNIYVKGILGWKAQPAPPHESDTFGTTPQLLHIFDP